MQTDMRFWLYWIHTRITDYHPGSGSGNEGARTRHVLGATSKVRVVYSANMKIW